MEEFQKKDFSKILKHNGLDARRWMKETDSECARVYDRNLEGIDVTVDLYGPYARILDYSEEGLDEDTKIEIEDIVRRFLYIEGDRIIFKERKKREGREQHEADEEKSLSLFVKESGLYFKVEMEKYVDTGLFLDHTLTRRAVQEGAAGLDVLNLFSYTGSFSVYAAAGGAASVTSVDLSNVYSSWARENLEKNGFLDEKKYPCVSQGALEFINEAIAEHKKYDLIVFDPPAFSNSHKAKDFDVKKHHLAYLLKLNLLLREGGTIIFSENLSSFSLDKQRLKAWYKVLEITEDVRQMGFTRKKNALRVWSLQKVNEIKGELMKRISDDDSLERLTLSWDEDDSKKERRDFDRPQRRERREFDGERRGDRRDRGERRERNYDRPRNDRPYYEKERRYYTGESDERPEGRNDDYRSRNDRNWGEKRSYGDRDRRDFDRPRRDFSDRPRREYGDRPRRDFSDRPRRDFDGDRSNSDRPRRDFNDRPRRDYNDRPRRDFNDRPRRDFDGERRDFDRPRRDFSDRPRRDFNDRPRRDFNDRPRRDFSDRPRRDFEDRPRRDFDGEKKPFRAPDRKSPRVRKGPVPYGYDSFRDSKRVDEDKENN